MLNTNRLNFSGHESFHCRELWLKKGFDFVVNGHSFSNPSAVVELGVGKNMVTAIYYWMTAFDLLTEDKELTDFAQYLFSPNGKDLYLEDNATLWLLHYHLIKKKRASIYSLFFNQFRKEKPEFSRDNFIKYLVRSCEEKGIPFSENTIKTDVGVFFQTYLKPLKGDRNFKSLLSGLLVDLELIERIEKTEKDQSKGSWFSSTNGKKGDIPAEIILFCIMDNENYGDSVSLYSLLNGPDSVGSIFALTGNDLVQKIKELTEEYTWITYMDDAGIKEIQFKKRPNKWMVLDKYYG